MSARISDNGRTSGPALHVSSSFSRSLSAAVVALAVPGMASARDAPPGAPFRRSSPTTSPTGSSAAARATRRSRPLRPGVGPTTSRQRVWPSSCAATEVKPHIGRTPPGRPLIGTDTTRWLADRPLPHVHRPRVADARGTGANNTLYRIASSARAITAFSLAHDAYPRPRSRSSMSRRPRSGHPVDEALVDSVAAIRSRTSTSLGQQIQAQQPPQDRGVVDRRRALLLLLALLGARAAVTAVPAALLINLGPGVAQVSNEVLLVVGIFAGTVLLAFALAASVAATTRCSRSTAASSSSTRQRWSRDRSGRRSTHSARRRTRGSGESATRSRRFSSCRSSPEPCSRGGGSALRLPRSSASSVSS